MGNYLYNGVELPALPEWDKTAYPYAMLRSYRTMVSANPITYVQKYDLYVLSVRPYKKADSDALYILEDAVLRSATCEDGVWGEFSDETTINAAWGGYIPFWTNTDILYEDGAVFLAASTPVPVPTYDPEALLQGYLVGCRLRAQRGKKKIVGYSYNGTVLPGLPEWDKTAYPYAVIDYFFSPDFYVLYVSSTPFVNVRHDGKDLDTVLSSPNSPYCHFSVNSDTGTEWGNFREVDSGDNAMSKPIWTNTDILYEDDGSVYLAASEPVPVYE